MKWIFGVIFVWLIFVMSLAGWWLYFGITTLSNAASIGVPSELARHQRMLFTEGTVLLVSLLVGGLALFYFAYRMYKEKSMKEIFFASFTHDLKTSLFRLQLEVEQLSKNGASLDVAPVLGHTRKMQLDLENSLDSAIGDSKKLFFEEVNMKNFIQELHTQWPEFHIRLTGEDLLVVDKKALHSICKNLMHNSFVHGRADEVSLDLKKNRGRMTIHYSDNGQRFIGDESQLGISSRYSIDGSGFGLYIVRQWISKMSGKIQFVKSSTGSLEIMIDLPGGLK